MEGHRAEPELLGADAPGVALTCTPCPVCVGEPCPLASARLWGSSALSLSPWCYWFWSRAPLSGWREPHPLPCFASPVPSS